MNKIIAIILAAACANSPAFELALTQTEKAFCESEGGCIVISDQMLRMMIDKARSACERAV